jgi:protein SCO1/2
MSTVVGAGFRRYLDASDPNDVRFDPGFIIVDGNGVVRGDYQYQTLADEADKLVRHLDILAGELRHADGPAGAAYEAAHLFLCYP